MTLSIIELNGIIMYCTTPLGGCPRIGTVARKAILSQIFWSFEANSCYINRK